MNHRETALAILNYQPYDQMPVVHFGFWDETLRKWAKEGHITQEEATQWGDGNPADQSITRKLGFDFNWYSTFQWDSMLKPIFEPHLVRRNPDGSREVMNGDGVTIVEKDDATSIPTEVEHLLKDRRSWQEHYLPKMKWSPDRINWDALDHLPPQAERDYPLGLSCGSLWGRIRDIVGLVGLSYLMADDPALVDEILEATAEICYQGTQAVLEHYHAFDFAHFWEDICYRAGPLVNPIFFHKKVGPYYRRITDLVNSYGIHIVSLDCDGMIDKLVPTWFENGVNTMFPIEVGVWNASIAPWRAKFGKELRGVGGASKVILARDYAAVDAEVERLRPLVELGGYIPCFDHRIPPDAKWENVQYYGDRMRQEFGK